MLVLKINSDLRDGQDEEGGDVGGHQLIHRVPFQPYQHHCFVRLLADVEKSAADDVKYQKLLVPTVGDVLWYNVDKLFHRIKRLELHLALLGVEGEPVVVKATEEALLVRSRKCQRIFCSFVV